MLFGVPKWILAGSIGGAIGAAVWAAITYFANAEVGYVAWGIGFLVGFLVRFAAGENEEGFAPGLTAALIAIVAVLGGKYAAVQMLVDKHFDESALVTVTANDMIVQRADNIIKARQASGQQVAMPGGIALEDATEEAHYPRDVWQQAQGQWTRLPAAEQQKQIEDMQVERAAMLALIGGSLRNQASNDAFAATFSLFDILWFFLAAGTAYRLGAGNIGTDD